MPRLPALNPTQMSERQREVHNAIAAGPRGEVVGPLAAWLNRPELADAAQKLGQYCRYDSSLPPRLSELAILVTARIWNAAFEWQSHEQEARNAGLGEEIIDALRHDKIPVFDNRDEELVYQISLTLNQDRRITDQLYSDAEKVLGKDRLVDLIGVLGYYSLISMTINAFELDPLYVE